MFRVPEQLRLRDGLCGTTPKDGCNGVFLFRIGGRRFQALASDGEGWEHVSVKLTGADRCPTWEEMCKVKGMFWDEEDCVVQFHPPKSQYVNCDKYVLHLWRRLGRNFETPPMKLV